MKGKCGRSAKCKRLCVESCHCPLGEERRLLLLKQRRLARSIARVSCKGGNMSMSLVTEAVLTADRFEMTEVKKDDDSFVIINRWLRDDLSKAKVIILSAAEAKALVVFLNQFIH